MNEDLRRMNVLQTLDELAHHDGRDKVREIVAEWQDKNPVSQPVVRPATIIAADTTVRVTEGMGMPKKNQKPKTKP